MDVIVKTKIVCTIGPATESVSAIKALHDAGMTVARINCSHGDQSQYGRFIRNIKSVSKNIAIMFDTQGPEIRTGEVRPGTVLISGNILTLTTQKVLGDSREVSVNYHGLVGDAKVGDSIFIDSGFLELKVIKKTKTDIICRIITGGPLGSRKGVNHPCCLAKIPTFTKKDREDLEFGIVHGIDFIAVSFVRGPGDVMKVKSFLNSNHHIKVFAKIENAVAVDNFDSILEVSDGIMVARGDLGVELPGEKVPMIQKEIIHKCNIAGKPVVTATQMMESMVNNPRPTRAETSDVANAILDGTDAVMLSEETAIGKYPAKAVAMMVNVARNTEPFLALHREWKAVSTDEAIARAVSDIVKLTGISKVVVATCSGYSARIISKYRPKADIIAVTPDESVIRQMGIYWGIEPLILRQEIHSTRDLIYNSLLAAYNKGLIKKGEKVVATAAHPFNIRGRTNLIEVHNVSDVLRYGPSAK